jgi:LPS export ABC transporter protein LptC
MMKDPRNILWIVPLAALLTLPLWKPLAADFLSPEREITAPSVPSLTNSRVLTSTEMDGVHFEQSKNGAKEWLLTASRLYSIENNSDMQLEDVNASFFGTPGKSEETRIRGQKARYNSVTKQINLHGGVVIQNDKGYEMQTESLEYLEKEKKITTDSKVKITGNNISVSGESLMYDLNSGNYRLEGNVVCKVW